jgi:hypothetical protein
VLQRVPLLKDCGYDYSKVVHGELRVDHGALARSLVEGRQHAAVDDDLAFGLERAVQRQALLAVRSAKDDVPLYTLVSSPVYPGETIVTDVWVDKNVVSFRCRLKERDVTEQRQVHARCMSEPDVLPGCNLHAWSPLIFNGLLQPGPTSSWAFMREQASSDA